MNVTAIKGVGQKTAELLKKININDVEEVLLHYPRNYDIYEKPIHIREIDNRAVVSIEGTVIRSVEIKNVNKLTIITTLIKDDEGEIISLKWYNMPFLRSMIKYSMKFVFRGRIKRVNNNLILEQPEIFTLAKYDGKVNEMQPIYALTKGLSNNMMIKTVKEALSMCSHKDFLPDEYLKKYELCDYKYAINNIHFPTDYEAMNKARKRIAFNEFFSFLYKLKKLKENQIEVPNQYIINNFELSDKIINNLEFELTHAQKSVLFEIRDDLSGNKVMQRLIQGDVGCGKTIIAFLAMFDMAMAGLQSALMVPTEVLAEQHFENITKIISDNKIDIEVVLLTGSLTIKQKRKIYEKIEKKEALIIIGTHAIFQEKVVYDRLALVVIDEQHRFGVMQRATLIEKGITPHVIIMSATPIPRTLAIILYGNMDISIIDELPSSRLPVKNCVVTKEHRERAYKFIKDEVKKGRQAYVICPMVEESDMLEAENVVDYSKILSDKLPKDINIEYLHGKMSSEQKNSILRKFYDNEIQVLVSTTVIEVGINVPNATVMMIENAERFSLASLHQLRGRVGRGEYQSYCIFISATKNEDKLERLNILKTSNDGFYIASEDLKLRGPGDFFGIRQSGEMQFDIADIYTDGELLKKAKDAVENLESENIWYEY